MLNPPHEYNLCSGDGFWLSWMLWPATHEDAIAKISNMPNQLGITL
ncbi:MAG: hypothetical protein P8L44_23560 [Opitutales bacterium]|nr:hypothetical protein [Opitutales bacterium]